jgi:hypothetical protein
MTVGKISHPAIPHQSIHVHVVVNRESLFRGLALLYASELTI